MHHAHKTLETIKFNVLKQYNYHVKVTPLNILGTALQTIAVVKFTFMKLLIYYSEFHFSVQDYVWYSMLHVRCTTCSGYLLVVVKFL